MLITNTLVPHIEIDQNTNDLQHLSMDHLATYSTNHTSYTAHLRYHVDPSNLRDHATEHQRVVRLQVAIISGTEITTPRDCMELQQWEVSESQAQTFANISKNTLTRLLGREGTLIPAVEKEHLINCLSTARDHLRLTIFLKLMTDVGSLLHHNQTHYYRNLPQPSAPQVPLSPNELYGEITRLIGAHHICHILAAITLGFNAIDEATDQIIQEYDATKPTAVAA